MGLNSAINLWVVVACGGRERNQSLWKCLLLEPRLPCCFWQHGQHEQHVQPDCDSCCCESPPAASVTVGKSSGGVFSGEAARDEDDEDDEALASAEGSSAARARQRRSLSMFTLCKSKQETD